MNEDMVNDAAPGPLVDQVEAAIRRLLIEGLAVTPDVDDYLESTLGSADPAAAAVSPVQPSTIAWMASTMASAER